METIQEIALLGTAQSTVADAVRYLDETNTWDDLVEFVNDQRVFVIDRTFTLEEIRKELTE